MKKTEPWQPTKSVGVSRGVGAFTGDYRIRIAAIGVLLLIGLVTLQVRLYFEQIHSGEKHRELVERQSIRRIRIPAPRGRILSSDLVPLADNEGVFNVVFYLEEMRQPGKGSKTIDYALNVSRDLAARFDLPNDVTREKLIGHRRGLPFVAFENISDVQLAKFFEVAHRYRGVGIEPAFVRVYPQHKLAALLVGYVRPDDPSKAADRREFSFYLPDWVGRSGLEAALDKWMVGDRDFGLRGVPGYSIVQVDYLGYVSQKLIDEVPPINGDHVILTLNAKAQKIAENLLHGQTGAMVVLDADTGEVLAMASSPTYDLQEFMPSISTAKFNELLADPRLPMFNRPLQGSYMPGSILKPLVALAIVNAGVSPYEAVVCDGGTKIGNARVRCTGVHGTMTLATALQYSCNDYFVEMGMRVGFDALVEVFQSAKIGAPTGIELGGARGKLPSKEAFKKATKRNWNVFETGLIGIGQGQVEVSPLIAAVYTAALANGGKVMRPYLLKSINDEEGRVLYETQPEVASRLQMTAAGYEVVKEGMRLVVESGSGRNARNKGIELSGKTGTAEVGPKNKRIKNTWFVGFGERNSRRYAIAVLVEQSRSGGRDCAPLAAQFFERWLGDAEAQVPEAPLDLPTVQAERGDEVEADEADWNDDEVVAE